MNRNLVRVASAFLLLLAAATAAAFGGSRSSQGYSVDAPEDWKIGGEVEEAGRHVLAFEVPAPGAMSSSVVVVSRSDVDSVEQLKQKEDALLGKLLVSSEEQPAARGKEFVQVVRGTAREFKTRVVYRFENGMGYAITFSAADNESYAAQMPQFDAFLAGLAFFPHGPPVAPLGFTKYDASLGRPTSHDEDGSSFDGEIEVTGQLRVAKEEGTCEEACAWFEPDAASRARLPRPILAGNTEPYTMEAIWLGEARKALSGAFTTEQLNDLLGGLSGKYSVPVRLKLSDYRVEITCDWAYFSAEVRELHADVQLASRKELPDFTTC